VGSTEEASVAQNYAKTGLLEALGEVMKMDMFGLGLRCLNAEHRELFFEAPVDASCQHTIILSGK
jgi:hypothetical protein